MTMGNLINHLDVSELFWVEVGGVAVFLPRGSRLTSVNEASQRLGEENSPGLPKFPALLSPNILVLCCNSSFLCFFSAIGETWDNIIVGEVKLSWLC